MDTMWWVVLFAALFIVLALWALRANARRSKGLPTVNPYASGEDTSPNDSELGRDSDLDFDRRREADFDEDR